MPRPKFIQTFLDAQEAGADVRARREKAGLTQRELADLLKIKTPYMSDLENGNRNWRVELYEKTVALIAANKKAK